MKIAYVFYDRPNYTAGPRINALRVLPEFVRRGHDVTALIHYYEECPASDILQSQGVKVMTTPWMRNVEDQITWFRRAICDIDPDIFVPNISIAGCYASRYVREAGRPTIAGHLSDDSQNWAMAETFCKRGDPWAVSGLFCMGRELGDRVRQWHPSRTTVVDIPHGVPVPAQTADVSGPIKIVYAGRFEQKQKRILDLTDALCSVLARHPDASVRMLGDGSKKEEVAGIIHDRGLGERMELVGYVSPDDVQAEMLSANVMVLLSDFEGVPGAVMDAMACGVIPVCLDIPGGLRELVIHEETGLLVSDRHEAFQLAIARLNDDPPLRSRLASNARAHIQSRFSLEIAVGLWERLFERLCQEAGPRGRIVFPRRLALPPRNPDFGPEDVRAAPRSVKSIIGRVRNRFFK